MANRRQMIQTNQHQDSDTTSSQDFVAPALCYIPLWAAGLVTSFVTPAWRENAFFDWVLDRTERDTAGIVRQSERMSEKEWETKWKNRAIFEGSRRPTKGCSGTVAERQRCIDEQTKYSRVRVNNENWALNHFNWYEKKDYAVHLFILQKGMTIF